MRNPGGNMTHSLDKFIYNLLRYPFTIYKRSILKLYNN